MNKGAFRFTYFTNKYKETFRFYQETLGFEVKHLWDRSENDKGVLFKAGVGLIEILQAPNDASLENSGLDYRKPQGAFMCIQVGEIDDLFEKYNLLAVPFKQKITDQSWGHRTFTVLDPNGIAIYFFEERF